jgi:hypothetical protein
VAAPTAPVAEAVREGFKLAPATSAPPPTTPPQKFEYPEEREEIEITNDIADMRDAAAQAITSHPYIVVAYKQSTPMLCDLIAETDVTGRRAFAVRKLSATHLKAELCRVSTWFARSKDGEKQIKRPDDTAVAALLACGTWPDQRRIRGVVGTPVFRPNGTLIQVPGHDPSGIFFDGTQCSGLRRVSEDPSAADCQLALSRMRYVIKDFPSLKSPTSPSRCGYRRSSRSCCASAFVRQRPAIRRHCRVKGQRQGQVGCDGSDHRQRQGG